MPGAGIYTPEMLEYLRERKERAARQRAEKGRPLIETAIRMLPPLMKSTPRTRPEQPGGPMPSGDPTTDPEYMAAKRARVLKESGYGEDFVGPVQEQPVSSAMAMPQTSAAIPPEVAEYARQRVGGIQDVERLPTASPGTAYAPPAKEQFELEAEEGAERERERVLERSRNIRGFSEGLDLLGRSLGGLRGGRAVQEPMGGTPGLDEQITRQEDYVPLATRRMLEAKGIKVPEGARLSDLEKILPAVTRLTEGEIDRETRGREAQMKAIADIEKARQKKPLSEAKATEVAGIDETVRRIDEIIAEKPQFNTGPWVSRFESVLGLLGAGDWNPQGPEKKAFNAKLNALLQTFVRAMEGGKPSDKDREFLATVTPRPEDDDQELLRKAGQLREWMVDKKSRVIAALEQSGRETTGLSQIEFYDPDTGQTLDVPEDEIDRFMESRPNAVRQG